MSILKSLLTMSAVAIWLVPSSASAANIITFGANANSCGGAVMCSTNGTTGYLINGTGQAFDLSTLPEWFQIDQDGVSYLPGQPVEPDAGAGGFLVVMTLGQLLPATQLRSPTPSPRRPPRSPPAPERRRGVRAITLRLTVRTAGIPS
jgi:hypothetical protein